MLIYVLSLLQNFTPFIIDNSYGYDEIAWFFNWNMNFQIQHFMYCTPDIVNVVLYVLLWSLMGFVFIFQNFWLILGCWELNSEPIWARSVINCTSSLCSSALADHRLGWLPVSSSISYRKLRSWFKLLFCHYLHFVALYKSPSSIKIYCDIVFNCTRPY